MYPIKPRFSGERSPQIVCPQPGRGHARDAAGSRTTLDGLTHADMTVEEKALALTASVTTKPGRYHPNDKFLAFLDSL